MTTIILVAIGILLAAAAALMVLFYGGGAFGTGDVKARADGLQNVGANVEAAASLYRASLDRTPGSYTELASTGEYLRSRPQVPGTDGTIESDWRTLTRNGVEATAFVVKGVPDDLCAQLNRNLRGTADIADHPTGRFGCMSDATDGNLYYALLAGGAAASGTGFDDGTTPAYGTDVSDILQGRDALLGAVRSYAITAGSYPTSAQQVVQAGLLPALPGTSAGTFAPNYIYIARSLPDAYGGYYVNGNKPAIHIAGVTDAVCRAVNQAVNGQAYIPEWPESNSGCFYWGTDGKNHVYAYTTLSDVRTQGYWNAASEFDAPRNFVFMTPRGAASQRNSPTQWIYPGYIAPEFSLMPEGLEMHPDNSGGAATLQFVAPQAGTYDIQGQLSTYNGSCGDGVDVNVDGSTSYLYRSVRPFRVTKQLAKGGIFAVSVTMHGAWECDGTNVQMQVRRTN